MNLFLRFLFMGAVCLLPLVGCSDDDTEGTGPEPTSDFQFETLELTQGSFKVKITPEDKNMTYFFGVLEKSDFSQFENLESLQAANIENIKALAEANGVGVEEFLLEALLKGEQEWKYNTLVPETDYVFYAYGLSTELEILTTVNTYEFKTLVVEQVEVNFKITASDVTPTSFTLNVEPDRTDCVYYYDILLPAVYMDYCGGDPANLPAFVENYLAEWKKTEQYATYTLPEFIAEVTVSGKTSDSSFENLLPEGTYYAFAVCVANDGTCISEATVETIRTSESPKNSYTVSSEVVTDVAYSAVVTAEQSEAFAVMMELQEYFADAKSDAEIIQTIYDAYNQNITNYIADSRLVKTELFKNIEATDANLYLYDAPYNSLTVGGILFPKGRNRLESNALETALDSVLWQSFETDSLLLHSLKDYERNIGVLRSRPTSELTHIFHHTENPDSMSLDDIDRNSVNDTYYIKTSVADSIMDGYEYGYLLDDKEVMELLQSYRGLLPEFSDNIGKKELRVLRKQFNRQKKSINRSFYRKIVFRPICIDLTLVHRHKINGYLLIKT